MQLDINSSNLSPKPAKILPTSLERFFLKKSRCFLFFNFRFLKFNFNFIFCQGFILKRVFTFDYQKVHDQKCSKRVLSKTPIIESSLNLEKSLNPPNFNLFIYVPSLI